jgi:hypothetical protein
MWHSWNSLESFNLWHEDIMYRLQIPNENIESYTSPVVSSENDIRAYVLLKDIRVSSLIGLESESPYSATTMP